MGCLKRKGVKKNNSRKKNNKIFQLEQSLGLSREGGAGWSLQNSVQIFLF
jgi:hypothetical protein